jgi:hypothetical protein
MGLLTAAPCGLEREARTPPRASLLPKVRDHFAEFLNQGSLVRLGLLDLSTGVGVRYGRWVANGQAFRDRPGVRDLAAACALASCSLLGQRHGVAVPPYQLERTSSVLSRSPPASRMGGNAWSNGAGISTCCPSPTPFGLGLGPTNPLRNDRAAEPLDMRRWGFAPHESLLIPTFALAFAPHGLPLMLLCLATLPYHTAWRTRPYPALRRPV